MAKGKIVYSTNPDWQDKCPDWDKPVDNCVCKSGHTSTNHDRVIKIKREVKGRGGKTVTTISNIGGDTKNTQKELQRLCGAGGTVKNGVIEIQGDHREKIRIYLQKNGYVVKLSGG